MYEAFYGFKEKPFSMLPDPGFLFLGKKHQAALTLLEYGLLNHVGFCVLSGEPGAGKTTIVRALLENVGDDITVGLITNTHRSFGGLLDWILSAFNLHRSNLTQVEMHQIFMDFLIEEYANQRSVLLIVDEAQNMTADALEELRMLSNVNSEKDQLMQIILAGQPALKEMLRKPELMQFAQRIAVDYHLGALDLEETCGYIQHRLLTAGAEKDVFTPAACERIHNYSGGTPRLINLLCETVLVYGFADQLEMIDVDLVDEMVQERMKNSVVPIFNRNIAKQDNKKASKKLEKDFPWIRPEGKVLGVKPQTIEDDVVPVKNAGVDAQSPVEGLAGKTEETLKNKKAEEDVKTTTVDDTSQVVKEETGAPKSVSNQNSENQKSVNTHDIALPAKKEVADRGDTRKSLVKYVVISAVLGLVLIAAAILLNYANKAKLEIVNNKFSELQYQLELEKEQLQIEAEAKAEADADADADVKAKAEAEAKAIAIEKARAEAEVKAIAIAKARAEAEVKAIAIAKARAEAEVKAIAIAKAEILKKERDAALAKIKEEKRLKEEAEKLATQRVALAVEVAEKKRKEEQKRIAKAKSRAQAQTRAKAKERERKAKQVTAQRKAAEQQKNEQLFQQARLERKKRIKQQEEARRLEREWLEQERQALREAEASRVARRSGDESAVE